MWDGGNMAPMSTPDLKSHIRGRIAEAKKMFLEDFEAMPEDQLAGSPGGCARTPYDLTFECVYVNGRVAKRLRGEDPGPFQQDGWMKAPAEFGQKESAARKLSESTEEVLAAWDALPAERVTEKIALPNGETSPLELASLVATHLTYHDAQLNYVQTLHGDAEMHWKF